ncbi:hypothetical protein BG000_006161, partial [Podila horticola]
QGERVPGGIISTHITENTLESYCCLIRYLYTGVINLDVDLNDLAIGYLPSEPFAVANKTCMSVKGLFSTPSTHSSRSLTSSKSGSKRDPSSELSSEVGSPGPKVASTLWKDVFQVADCHDVKELRDHCRDKIIADLCVSNVLEILFEFAYRYDDLKEEVLKFLADNIGQMYARDPDPFSAEVEQDNEYRFCIVVSIQEDILELFRCQKVAPRHPIVEAVEPEPAPLGNDIMMTLLKDIYSVLFASNNSFADFSLWAHRSILPRLPVLCGLITQESAVRSSPAEGRSEFSPLTLMVDQVSLATFCAVLMFIYSGKIERTVNSSKLAISKPQTSLTAPDTAARIKDAFRWNPMHSDSPWNIKPATWSELLIAADIYKIDTLHARCQEKAREAIDEKSTVEALFQVGSHSQGVKTTAVDFSAKNMRTLLVDGKNSFTGFVEDKKCHDMIIEVMRTGVKEL